MNYVNVEGQDELEFYKMLVDTLSQMISITVLGPKGDFVYASQVFMEGVNITPETLIGKGSKEMVSEGYYEDSSSIKAYAEQIDAKSIFHSKDNHFVLSESKIVSNSNNSKFIVTHCARPLQIYNDVAILQEKIKSYKNEIQILRTTNLNENLKEEANLIFKSKEMYNLITDIKKIAPTNATVLLLGESGVGKEVIAKTIFANSKRKNELFIPICIPLMTPSLLESELFGYVKGAFTNADKNGKAGLFEVANGGTVFLDEVGDIPLDLQIKLLRVLENKEISRIGSSKMIKLDIRVISATNKNLIEMVKKGLFREDLLYRLSVIQLYVKPLRERKDDIIPLTNYYISIINKSYGYQKKFLSEAYNALEKYDWPGNVRELKNVIEKIIILSDGVFITDRDVVSSINQFDSVQTTITEKQLVDKTQKKSVVSAYNDIDSQKILDTLISVNGNRTKAAKLLGISRSKLYRKLKENIIDTH